MNSSKTETASKIKHSQSQIISRSNKACACKATSGTRADQHNYNYNYLLKLKVFLQIHNTAGIIDCNGTFANELISSKTDITFNFTIDNNANDAKVTRSLNSDNTDTNIRFVQGFVCDCDSKSLNVN